MPTINGGPGNDTLNGTAGPDTLNGLGGHDELNGGDENDVLNGGLGDDTLDGGAGNDKMTGGAGHDLYVVDSYTDTVVELAGGGFDNVTTKLNNVSLASYANVEQLTLVGTDNLDASGDIRSNIVVGNDGNNKLDGGAGNDTLAGGGGVNTLIGGLGNDVYYVDSLLDAIEESVGKGKDTVHASNSYWLAAGQEIEGLTLDFSGNTTGVGNEFANTITGNAGNNFLDGDLGNDTLKGNEGSDTINGSFGNDVIDGGIGEDFLFGGDQNDKLTGGDGDDTLHGDAGADTMTGGKGQDIYYVDNAGDKVIEVGKDTDLVVSELANYTLTANVENILITGLGLNGKGNALANTMQGSGLDNKLDGAGGNDYLLGQDGVDTLLGGAGNDTLDGGTMADVMTGGAGNDWYVLADAGDTINELAGGGIDRIDTELDNVNLANYANVENLLLHGTGDLAAGGNDLSNIIGGTTGANTLDGGKGNDTLIGGAGSDALTGGLGNDTFYVDDLTDLVTEGVGQGKDTVHSFVAFTIQDTQEIETLVLDSSVFIGGVGNNLANTITMIGSGQAVVDGKDGNDTLTGGGTDDVLRGGNDNDVVNGGAGNDQLNGEVGNDKLTGGEGDDRLTGAEGKDTLIGGKGDDYYVVTETSDVVIEASGQGHDTVDCRIANYTLGANLEDLYLVGAGVNGTGNALNNLIVGNNAANILMGGGGRDELVGGRGADTLRGGIGNDIVEGGEGADVMFGEGGNDVFRYVLDVPGNLSLLGGDTINGFQHGLDKINLADLLSDFGITPANAFSGGFVQLIASGADMLVQFDSDAGGAASPVTLATVTNATVTQGDIILA